MAISKRTPEYRFWSKVEKTSTCWFWTGSVRGNGYGSFLLDGVYVSTHRYSWELANKRRIPKGLCVCHSCDVPGCVNPEHLFLGTHADNMLDRKRKGRGTQLKTYCANGHPFTPENSYYPPRGNGERACRQCRKAWKVVQEIRDRERRGLTKRTPKLTPEIVLAIRAEYARRNGLGCADMARRYGVNASTISRVARGFIYLAIIALSERGADGPLSFRRIEQS